ncbi:MAG: helix-turn-helix domain-containing protein [Lachnospiraceae bacterium]|nr:helix-turn-helix domain-containing protein [Lachnospiraceae bacterium]
MAFYYEERRLTKVNIVQKEQGKEHVPIHEKVTLTIKEAAEYSNIGINRIENLLKSPRCPFVLYVGTKKLVKRKEFEKFIAENIQL